MSDDDQRPFTIMMGFRLTHRLMVEELIERLKADGHETVHPSHHALYENIDPDGTRLTELAARADMTHQSMGELVANLERAGWVERRPDPTDGRARLVCLTPAGKELVRRGLKHIADIEAEWQERWRGGGHDGDLRPVLERAIKDRNAARMALGRGATARATLGDARTGSARQQTQRARPATSRGTPCC